MIDNQHARYGVAVVEVVVVVVVAAAATAVVVWALKGMNWI